MLAGRLNSMNHIGQYPSNKTRELTEGIKKVPRTSQKIIESCCAANSVNEPKNMRISGGGNQAQRHQ